MVRSSVMAWIAALVLVPGCAPLEDTVREGGEEAVVAGPVSPGRERMFGIGARTAGNTVEERIPPPGGFARVDLPPGGFGVWLRGLPLRPGRSVVRLFDARPKPNQRAHHAVLDVDVGRADLQQCADAVIRLRAEFLLAAGCADDIRFRFTSGDVAAWSRWRQGWRPSVERGAVTWARSAAPDHGYRSFRAYLDTVFTYAGSASLERELVPVPDPSRPRPGDVFIQGGFPGHAVLVVDVARDAIGQRVFLLAQSFMPAQDIHVLRSAGELDPWYVARSAGPMVTPEWRFEHGDLRRFPTTACERAAATPDPTAW